MTKRVKVIELCLDPYLLTAADGDVLYRRLRDIHKDGEQVQVDFNGCSNISSAFLNRAFGRLCIDLDWTSDYFRKSVEMIDLCEDDIDDVELTLDNAQFRCRLIRQGVTDLKDYFEARIPDI